ncbi:tol-pal system YbgF family protein [candidate division KSB1 bacterium]
MLKPRKRVTKKQLKEDKLITTVYNVQNYLEKEWQKLAIIAGAAALVIIAGYYIYNRNLEKENLAKNELWQYEYRYFAGLLDSTLVTGLEQFLQRHGDTGTAGNAAYYLADTYYNLDQYAQAEEYFNTFLEDYDGPEFLKASALGGIASCYEQRGLWNEAAEYYTRAAREYQDEFLAPENMIGAARVLLKLGNTEQAHTHCQAVIEKYPNTQHALEAEILLAK